MGPCVMRRAVAALAASVTFSVKASARTGIIRLLKLNLLTPERRILSNSFDSVVFPLDRQVVPKGPTTAVLAFLLPIKSECDLSNTSRADDSRVRPRTFIGYRFVQLYRV